MPTGDTQLFSQALSLPSAQREELAVLLFDSLPEEDDSPIIVDEELEREIDRRLAELAAGTARTVDRATFSAMMRAASILPASS